MRIFPFLVLISLITGCATTLELSEKGRGIRLMKGDPDADCKELGDVSWVDDIYVNTPVETAKIGLRNKAADMGANYVRMESLHEGIYGTIRAQASGTAYLCPAS